MDMFSNATSEVMRSFVAACQTPVVVLLLLGIAFAVLCVGMLIGEYFTEHRHFKVVLPDLVDELRASGNASSIDTQQVVRASGLLPRQKDLLVELTEHPEVTPAMRESLAVGLEHRERRRYENTVKVTDVASRIAPMLGLLGTLIPLGPGIMALSSGDTTTLANSLLVAFDTTSLGLIVAGVTLVISAIRKSWYKDYLASFDAALECILEVEKLRASAPGEAGDAR